MRLRLLSREWMKERYKKKGKETKIGGAERDSVEESGIQRFR